LGSLDPLILLVVEILNTLDMFLLNRYPLLLMNVDHVVHGAGKLLLAEFSYASSCQVGLDVTTFKFTRFPVRIHCSTVNEL
jgi:hypothetical protein